MNDADSKKVVDKVSKDTMKELSDYFRYWYRSYRSLGISLTQEYCMDHVPEIMDKKISELTDQEKLIMFIHFFIGDDFPIDPDVREKGEADEERKDCIKTASSCMNIFTKAYGEKINKLFNSDDLVPLLKMKHLGDLTKAELLILISHIDWDK